MKIFAYYIAYTISFRKNPKKT